MRDLRLLDLYRDTSPAVLRHYGHVGDGTCGVFTVPSPIDGAPMRVIASGDCGWEHVSVSRKTRCPNWPEMDHIKRLFFRDDECAVQFHVPRDDHISVHDYCLHLWRPTDVDMPRPPAWMVGGVSQAEADRLYREAMGARKDRQGEPA